MEYLDPELPPEQAVARRSRSPATHQRLIRSRIEMMRGYAETTGCRRQFLLGYFGEQLARAVRELRHLRGRGTAPANAGGRLGHANASVSTRSGGTGW